MKTASKLFASLLLSLSALSAQATVIQLTDVNNPADVQVTTSTPYSYIHNVSALFDSTLQTITSAVLNIVVTDPNNGSESYQVVIGTAPTAGTTTEGNINNGNGTKSVDYTLQTTTSLADLQNDGKLAFKITATSGEFFFASSTLTFFVDDLATSPNGEVPEPMTLGLFAAALLGLGLLRRRQN